MRKHWSSAHRTPPIDIAKILAMTVLVLGSAVTAFAGSANFFLGVDPAGNEEALAQYDEIVLSPISIDRAEAIYQIREYNTDIKIFFLIDFFVAHANEDVNDLTREYFAGIEDDWRIQSTTGDYVHYWPDSYQVNITDYCPLVNGRMARDYILDFFVDEVQPLLALCDGFYLDNCFESILWMSGYTGDIDLNLDGVGEESMEILYAVQDGWRDVLTGIRQHQGDILIIGNGTNHLYSYLDGRMVEDFPNSSYNYIYGGISMMETWRLTTDCKYSIVNSVAEEDDRKARRAAWAVSELTSQCVGFDSGPHGHNELQWDPLFDFDIGRPRENLSMEGDKFIHFNFEDGSTLGYVPSEVDVEWLHSDGRVQGAETMPLEGKWSVQLKSSTEGYQLLWSDDLEPLTTIANTYLSFRYKIIDAPENGAKLWPALRKYSGAQRVGFGERQIFTGEEGHFIMRGDMMMFPGSDWYLYIVANDACTIILDEIRLINEDTAYVQRTFDQGYLLHSLANSPVNMDFGDRWIPCPDLLFDGAWYESEGSPWLKTGETMVMVKNPNPGRDVSDDDPKEESVPTMALKAAFPNPFNPKVTIPFSLAEAEQVRMVIYDLRGRQVRALCDEVFAAGEQQLSWNGRDDQGHSLSSGVYFLKFITSSSRQTQKLVLAR